MLSIETESRLAKIFLTLAEGERMVEISRQVLSDNWDFDSNQIFNFLDIEGKSLVDSINIVDYLSSKGKFCSEQEAQLIILFYDEDGDGSLSYCEFVNLVQSDKSFRRNYTTGNSKLSFSIDYSLEKLLEKEIDLAKNIIPWLNDLKTRQDFNIHEWYHQVKSFDSITPDSIKSFLEKNNASFLGSDIKAVMKRLDLNSDGRIDLNEFHVFLGFPTCLRCCHCTIYCSDCCCCLNHSQRCCSRSPVRTCSPRRCSPRCCSRSCSPKRCSSRCSPRRDFKQSNNDTYIKYNESNINQFSSSTQNQTMTPIRNENSISPEIKRVSPNLSWRLSPERRFSPQRNNI
ncbi:MAG: EF-hand domain-containing protein, partial [Mycoplasma sp.]